MENRPSDTWTHKDILTWLRGTPFGDFANCFKWVKTSEHLFRLSMEDLCVMGVESAAAPVLFQEIQKLKERQNVIPTHISPFTKTRGSSVSSPALSIPTNPPYKRNSHSPPLQQHKQQTPGGSWSEVHRRSCHETNLSAKFSSLGVVSAPSSQHPSRNPSPHKISSRFHFSSLGQDLDLSDQSRSCPKSRNLEASGLSFQPPSLHAVAPYAKEDKGYRQRVSSSSPSIDHSVPLYSPRSVATHHSAESIEFSTDRRKISGRSSIQPQFGSSPIISPLKTFAPILRATSAPAYSLPSLHPHDFVKFKMSDIGANDDPNPPLSDFPLFLLNSLYNYDFSKTGLLILELPKFGQMRHLVGVERNKFRAYFSSKENEVVVTSYTNEDIAKLFERFWFKLDIVLPANSTVNDLYYCHLLDGSGQSYFRPNELWVSQIIDQAIMEKRRLMLKSYTNDEDAIELAKYALENNQINVDKFLAQVESHWQMPRKEIQSLRILLQGISTTVKVFPKYSIQPDSITVISLNKWREFLLRFGPISSLHTNLSSFLTSEVSTYYHGPLDRIQAENLLMEHFQNSHLYMCTFLLRDASSVQQSPDLQASYTFCVSCCIDVGRVEHWRIFQEGKKFFCRGQYFESLGGCVEDLRNLEWPLGSIPLVSEYYSNLKIVNK